MKDDQYFSADYNLPVRGSDDRALLHLWWSDDEEDLGGVFLCVGKLSGERSKGVFLSWDDARSLIIDLEYVLKTCEPLSRRYTKMRALQKAD